MLPYIFASQELQCIEAASSISFQSSDNTKSSTLDKKNEQAQFSVYASDNLLNPLKRKHACRENDYEINNLSVGNKKIISNSDHENTKEANVSVVNYNTSAMNCWDVEQSQSDAFNNINHYWTSSNFPYQELSHLVSAVCD